MKRRTDVFAAALVVIILMCFHSAAIAKIPAGKWVTTYHPTWWYGALKPSMIDFNSMSHITIFHAQDAMASAPYFNSAGIDDGNDFPQIVSLAHANGVKVLISAVGGYGQVNMPVVAADPVKCQAFVDAACAFAKSKNADGIELDWEFPRSSDDVGWNRLIRLFRQKLDTWSTKGILATSMFYTIGGSNVAPYHVDSMMVFDQINLMTYTMWMGSSAGQLRSGYDTPVNTPTKFPGYTGWSLSDPSKGPLTYLAAGYPASKIGIGISFEGTRFDGVTSLGQAYSGWGFTSTVTNSLSPGYSSIPASGRVWDQTAQANYCVKGTTVYSFQDTNSIKAISNWTKNHNFGGVMIYDIGAGYDKLDQAPNALLQSAATAFGGNAVVNPPSSPTGTFTVTPASLPAGGGTVTLSWTSVSASTAVIDQGVGSVSVNGSKNVAVTGSKTFTLTLTNTQGTKSYSASASVAGIPASGTNVIYSNNSVNAPWQDVTSWGVSRDYSNTSMVYNGTTSLKIVHDPWGSLRFTQGEWGSFASIDPSQYSSFQFALNGGDNGVSLQVTCVDASNKNLKTAVVVTAPAHTWVLQSIPMNSLATVPFTSVAITAGGAAVAFYVDDIQLATTAVVSDIVIYNERALSSPWTDVKSWSVTRNYTSTNPIYSGSTSLSVVHQPWASLQFSQGTWGSFVSFDPRPYYGLRFALHGGQKGVTLTVNCKDASGNTLGSNISASSPANTWTTITIPFSQLSTKPFDAITFTAGGANTTFSLDNLTIVSQSSSPQAVVLTQSEIVASSASTKTLLFTWNKLEKVMHYRLQISETPDFHPPTMNNYLVTDSTTTLILESDKTYFWRVRGEDGDSTGVFSDAKIIPMSNTLTSSASETQLPTEFALLQNFPNPFNPSTTIRYGVPTPSHVTITVYSILGQVVEEIVNKELSAGWHETVWDAHAASGMYLYKIVATSDADPSHSFTQMKKMTLLK